MSDFDRPDPGRLTGGTGDGTLRDGHSVCECSCVTASHHRSSVSRCPNPIAIQWSSLARRVRRGNSGRITTQLEVGQGGHLDGKRALLRCVSSSALTSGARALTPNIGSRLTAGNQTGHTQIRELAPTRPSGTPVSGNAVSWKVLEQLIEWARELYDWVAPLWAASGEFPARNCSPTSIIGLCAGMCGTPRQSIVAP